jgi:peptidoglycan-associated lipoprotein
MRQSSFTLISGLTVGSVVGLGACAHAAVPQTVQVANHPTSVAEAPKPPAASAGSAQSAGDADLEALVRGDAIHFSFNEAALTAESEQRLRRIGDLLRANQTVKLIIAGNCDERGTEEYNLALGEQRANAARKYLSKLGVESSRLSSITYGKERPIATGHDEASWAQNRRDDLQVARN